MHASIHPSLLQLGCECLLISLWKVTRVGGNVEQILNNKNGFLIEKNNDVKLSQRLEVLIKNKSMRKKFGRVSKRIALEKFNLEKSFKKYKKIYDEI